MRFPRSFYTRKTITVAKELLGKYLVRRIGKIKLVGKIVETEAYIGPGDKASHAYLPKHLRKFPDQRKITRRNKTEYLKGGHIYIYLVYGMYWQLNITTSGAGKPECVLIRALEPVFSYPRGLENRCRRKIHSQKPASKSEEIYKLANGPGKLCKWLKLDKSFDGEDLTRSPRIWLQKGERVEKNQIKASKRIGIDYAEEWANKPWRFYIKNNQFVSKQ